MAEQAIETFAAPTTIAGSRARCDCSASRTPGTANGRRWRRRSSAPSCTPIEPATRRARTIVTSLNVSLYYGPTPVEEVIRRYEAGSPRSRTSRSRAASTSCLLAGVLAMSGRFDEARSFAGRGTMILAELGQPVRLGIARAYVADAELLAGDARAAEHELVEAYATLDGIGNRSGAFSRVRARRFLCAQGRYDEADRWAAPGRDVLEDSDAMTRVTGLATEARLAAHAGRAEHAASLARRAVALADETDALNVRARTWLALAEVMRLAGTERGGRRRADCRRALRVEGQRRRRRFRSLRRGRRPRRRRIRAARPSPARARGHRPT